MASKRRNSPRFDKVSDRAVYLLSVSLARTYVLTQEFKLHNLGGNNVYDPNDVLASLFGLVLLGSLLLCHGVFEQAGRVT